jgi:hypothetical protein
MMRYDYFRHLQAERELSYAEHLGDEQWAAILRAEIARWWALCPW